MAQFNRHLSEARIVQLKEVRPIRGDRQLVRPGADGFDSWFLTFDFAPAVADSEAFFQVLVEPGREPRVLLFCFEQDSPARTEIKPRKASFRIQKKRHIGKRSPKAPHAEQRSEMIG